MNLLAPVSSIMTTNPITISPEETLQAARETFEKYHIHHIPVVENGVLVGMLSRSDFSLLKRGLNDEKTDNLLVDLRLNSMKVKSIMTKKIAKLDANDRINVAIEVFKENILHSLPVLENDRIVGILTTHDIIKHLAADNVAYNEYES